MANSKLRIMNPLHARTIWCISGYAVIPAMLLQSYDGIASYI